jgi:hypothetical protein
MEFGIHVAYSSGRVACRRNDNAQDAVCDIAQIHASSTVPVHYGPLLITAVITSCGQSGTAVRHGPLYGDSGQARDRHLMLSPRQTRAASGDRV